MHGIKSVAAVALLGLASAAPTPNVDSAAASPKGSFKVTNMPTENTVVRDGMVAFEKALNKHSLPFPADFTSPSTILGGIISSLDGSSDSSSDSPPASASSQKLDSSSQDNSDENDGGDNQQVQTSNKSNVGGAGNETGEVAANSIRGDVEYTSLITIGGQPIAMNFDTGSSDLWVMNTQMPSSETAGHTLYDPSKSGTFKQIPGASFQVKYGDASFASGNTVGTETVNIGGAQVDNQVIELASQVGAEFVSDTAANGLVGLAFGKLNTIRPQPAQTFFENVVAQLDQPVFTANLKHAATGAYEFGTIDKTQFSGDMTWVPIDTSSGFWQFASTDFQVGTGPRLRNPRASPAIADTGTSLVLMDPAVADRYYSQVAGAGTTNGGYVFPSNAQLPDLHIAVGTDGGMITIPGSLLAYSPFNSSHTFGGLQSNGGGGYQIFGDVMFKSQFVAFDIGQERLGFANHAN